MYVTVCTQGHKMAEGERDKPPIPRPGTSLRPEQEDDEDEPVPGAVSRRRFGTAMGVASAVFVFTVISFIGVGTVVGATVGPGIGGFVANFDDISYTDGEAEIYPVLDEHPACDGAPQIAATLTGDTTLEGDVEFYKDLPLPDVFEDEQIARFSIVAEAPDGGIEATDLSLRLTALAAEEIELGDTNIREFGPDDYEVDGDENDSFAPYQEANLDLDEDPDPEVVPEFGIDSDLFIVEDGTAAAHHVSLGSIDLVSLNLFIAIDDRNNFDNPVERVVEPEDRDCESLAEEQ